jgi:hypothetical protein
MQDYLYLLQNQILFGDIKNQNPYYYVKTAL